MSNTATKEMIDEVFYESLREFNWGKIESIALTEEFIFDFRENYVPMIYSINSFGHDVNDDFLHEFTTDIRNGVIHNTNEYYAKFIKDHIAEANAKNSRIRIAKIADSIIGFVYTKDVKDIRCNALIRFEPKEFAEKLGIDTEPKGVEPLDSNNNARLQSKINLQEKEETNPQQDLSVVVEQLKQLNETVAKIANIPDEITTPDPDPYPYSYND
jgi:hypothetical protein